MRIKKWNIDINDINCINAKLQAEILHFLISTIKQGDAHNIYLFRKYYLKKKTLL